MKSKIVEVLGKDKVEHKENLTYPQIHVVDLTQRTNGKQSLEIYDSKPENIDTLLIENPNLNITATFFKPQCFLNEEEKESDNCEGVLYLTDSNDETWILFLEIKDCEAKNISYYFEKAKSQLTTIVQIFRVKNIIPQNKKVYANISFPRRNKTDFYNQLIKAGESKQFMDNHKIFIRATNKLKIKNETTIF